MTFSDCKRRQGEGVTQFLASLRAQAGKCEFGSSLQERLRDQLVIGINEPTWQQEVLKVYSSNEVTLAQVEKMLISLEQAQNQMQRLKEVGRVNEVYTNATKVRVEQRKSSCKELTRGIDCFRCGYKLHKFGGKCPAEGKTCAACQGENHFARTCLKTGRASVQNNRNKQIDKRGCSTRRVRSEQTYDSDSNSDLQNEIYAVTQGTRGMLDVEINGHKVEMLYDPGACQTVISKALWKKIGFPKLVACRSLKAYTNVEIETLGKAIVTVRAFGIKKDLPLFVVETHDVPLFGFSWTLEFKLPLPKELKICSTSLNKSCKQGINAEKLKKQFGGLFEESLGKVLGYKANIYLKDNAIPKVYKPRPVPFALKGKVEEELKRLVHIGVLEPLDASSTPMEWASPMVVAPKPNNQIRLCADFKVTINKYLIVDRHPLPRFEDILEKLAGGKEFSTIDLRDAYLQIEVEEACKKFFVIATHVGYYVFKRLPFGVASATSI